MKTLKLALLAALCSAPLLAQAVSYPETDTMGADLEEDYDLPPAQAPREAPAPAAPVIPPPNLQTRILMQMQDQTTQPMGQQTIKIQSDDAGLQPDPEPLPLTPDEEARLSAPEAPTATKKAPMQSSGMPDAPSFRGSMGDFKTMHFTCISDASGDYLSSNICAMAKMRAQEIARDLRMAFRDGGKEDHDGFTLSVRLQSTGVKTPRAVTVRMEASRLYKAAVDNAEAASYPASTGRAGRLVFWDSSITAVSNSYNGNLDDAIRQYLRGMLKRFFDWYANQK